MIEKLASQLGRKDEEPNIQLAQELMKDNNAFAIEEIVSGVMGKDKAIANDCIKVLYEIGEEKPDLISPYANEFLDLLHSKNNRLVWGAMTALAKIAELVPEVIFPRLDDVLHAYENGSVITVDNSISVFAGLGKSNHAYEEKILPILLHHLATCRPKEVPQHGERASVCYNKSNSNAFLEVLESRKKDLSKTQLVRVEKLIKLLKNL